MFSTIGPSLFNKNESHDSLEENLEIVELQRESTYKPHYHKHSSAVIYIILGEGTFILGDDTINYYPGKRVLIPAGTLHGFNTKTRTLFLSIQSPPILSQTNDDIDIHY